MQSGTSTRRIVGWLGLAVNFVGLQLTLGCAYRLGSPANLGGPYNVGQVVVPAAEPGLEDALSAGLARGLAARQVFGQGHPVDLRVLSWNESAVASSGDGRVHEVTVALEVQSQGRRIRLTERQAFVVTDALTTSQHRGLVAGRLAESLAADIVDWLLFAPEVP